MDFNRTAETREEFRKAKACKKDKKKKAQPGKSFSRIKKLSRREGETVKGGKEKVGAQT